MIILFIVLISFPIFRFTITSGNDITLISKNTVRYSENGIEGGNEVNASNRENREKIKNNMKEG